MIDIATQTIYTKDGRLTVELLLDVNLGEFYVYNSDDIKIEGPLSKQQALKIYNSYVEIATEQF